jgi:hypothetical protein
MDIWICLVWLKIEYDMWWLLETRGDDEGQYNVFFFCMWWLGLGITEARESFFFYLFFFYFFFILFPKHPPFF